MSEKKPQEITGFEGEPGSYLVVDGKRVPNTDADPVTITPDHPEYSARKKAAEASLEASKKPAAQTPPAAQKGVK